MNKTNTSFFFAGLFIGLVLVGVIFSFLQPTPKVEQSQIMKECREAGGEFKISDWSLQDDGSDYRATCEIPEHYLWKKEIVNY